MRHKISSRTFVRRSGPRKALIRGLATNLIESERITTTAAKAKELRSYVEPLVTLAKRGDLHARRQISGKVYKSETVQKLFDQLAVRFKDRPGGYTRIIKSHQRLGDGAPLVIIEFLDRKTSSSEGKKTAPKKKTDAKKSEAKKPAKSQNTKKNVDTKAVKKSAPVKKTAQKPSNSK